MVQYEQGWLAQVLDAAGGAEVRAFFGFLRRGDRGTWRLYLTLDLDDYIEMDEAQILHSVSFEGSQFPLGGSLVWVRRTAKLKRVAHQSTEAQADFLRGQIAMEYIAIASRTTGDAMFKPPIGTGAVCTSYTGCTPCHSGVLSCGIKPIQPEMFPDPAPRAW
jgi:hypothetical protein